MNIAKPSCRPWAAKGPAIKEQDDAYPGDLRLISLRMRTSAAVLAMALSGCISVNAPDKPIVIELNMNIQMDVVYKLSGDASKTVDTNKEIF